MRWMRAGRPDERRARIRRKRVVLMPRRWHLCIDASASMPKSGDNKARSPGRARHRPLKPFACGNAGCPGVLVVTLLACFLSARKAAGASRARHSPRPLFGRKVRRWVTRAASRRGNTAARHHRACPGDPRLTFFADAKTWMAGSSPAMTVERVARGRLSSSLRGAKRRSNPVVFSGSLRCARDDGGGAAPLLRLQPLGSAAPQRVAVLGSEEAEVADLLNPGIQGRDGDDVRRRRLEAGAQQLDCGPRRPGIVGKMNRAQRALIDGEI